MPNSGSSIPEALLKRAFDATVDLIAMGDYGDPQLREGACGRVTGDLIEKAPIPPCHRIEGGWIYAEAALHATNICDSKTVATGSLSTTAER